MSTTRAYPKSKLGYKRVFTGAQVNSISDTTLLSPTNDQILKYKDSDWINTKLAFSDMDEVSIGLPKTNDIIRYDGNNWINSKQIVVDGVSATDMDVEGTFTDGSLTISSGNITNANFINADDYKINKNSVTQSSSISDGVTVNAGGGIITTVVATTVAQGQDRFTVTNNSVSTVSVVLANIQGYASGSTGLPVVHVDNIGSNTFDIVITNASTSAPLNALLKIGFAVH